MGKSLRDPSGELFEKNHLKNKKGHPRDPLYNKELATIPGPIY